MLMSFGNTDQMVAMVEKDSKGQEEKLQVLSVHVLNESRHIHNIPLMHVGFHLIS